MIPKVKQPNFLNFEVSES